MRQLRNALFGNVGVSNSWRKKVRHLAREVEHDNHATMTTLCGRSSLTMYLTDEVENREIYRKTTLCKTCARVRVLHDTDRIIPDATVPAIKRAIGLSEGGAAVKWIHAAVFRVQGSTDTYTVTIPDDGQLAGVCTCMAGKVHPETMCKHQVLVRGVLEKQREGKTE